MPELPLVACRHLGHRPTHAVRATLAPDYVDLTEVHYDGLTQVRGGSLGCGHRFIRPAVLPRFVVMAGLPMWPDQKPSLP